MRRCIHWTNTKVDAPIEEKMCPKRPDVKMSNKCINTDFVEDCGYFKLDRLEHIGGYSRGSGRIPDDWWP